MIKYILNFNISSQQIYISLIFVCILFFILVFLIIRAKLVKIVKNTSLRYKDIQKINSRYKFFELKDTYIISKKNSSKAQFDRFNYIKFLDEQIEQNIDSFNSIISATVKNAKLNNQYKDELESASQFTDKDIAKENKIPYFIYNRIEKKIITDIIFQPVLEPMILCKNSYRSPKGRNSYYSERIFYYSEFIRQYNIVCERIKKKTTKQYQRKLMTDSLRYDIMKRDGFRCLLCGRCANDGVKLHVDHIVPVAKGGKTIPNNLRTLCDSCNMGKRDKYDEYGYN